MQLDQEVMEKPKLRGKVRELEISFRQHEHAVKDLRAEVVDLNDCNRRYWEELRVAHGVQGEGTNMP